MAFPHWQRSAGDIMIRNIQPKHAGKYTCAVQTKVDSVSIATDVVVRGKHASVVFWVGLLICCFCWAQICEYVSTYEQS